FTRIRTAVTDEPMLLSRNVSGKKSIAFLGYGLWRWTMLADPSAAGILDAWMNTCMRWLSTRDDDRRIRISPVKEVFTGGEQVEFSGQVYDETLQPVEGAQVSVTVKSGRHIAGFTMKDLGNGQYDGQLQGLEEGDYTYEATVQKDGSLIGRVNGSLSVGESNAEFLETKANHLLLRQLATRTGGRFYSKEDLDEVSRDVGSLPGHRSIEVVRTTEFALWNLPASLLVVVLLFSLEWFLRKAKGML
ncbi:MAG TPA: carboxypeptidase-like regulatory domain-containing protein, partial [Bacteroidota bacterium]